MNDINKSPFLSFVIPVYNSQDYIGKCLESIIAIDYPRDRFEIIVVNNGSSDNTADEAKKFTHKILSLKRETIAKARNTGAAEAKGDFFVFVDSDCVIPKEWVGRALGYFNDDKVGMAGSSGFTVPENSTWVDKTWEVHLNKNAGIRETKWLAARAIMVRKSAFLSIHGFDERLVTCEDVDFGRRLAGKYKIISDSRLAPLHLDQMKTLPVFIRKESWRGRDSLKTGLKHPGEISEILSAMSIFYYLLCFLFFIPAMFIGDKKYLAIDICAITIPLFVFAFDTCKKTRRFAYFWKLVILYGAYNFARSIGVFIRWRK